MRESVRILLENQVQTWYNRYVNYDHLKHPDYTLIRSDRRTLSLSVDGEGNVVVRAPRSAGGAEIEAFVARHRRWIARRVAVLAAAKPEFSDGQTLALYGKPYRIAAGRAHFGEDVIFLPSENRERALIALLKQLARAHMTALAAMYAERHGFSYAGIRITSARGRWGSCNSEGALAFSYRTALLSEEQARYIVVHELCHTRFLDHSPAFWAEVGKIIPDYGRVRKSLRASSVVMNWL